MLEADAIGVAGRVEALRGCAFSGRVIARTLVAAETAHSEECFGLGSMFRVPGSEIYKIERRHSLMRQACVAVAKGLSSCAPDGDDRAGLAQVTGRATGHQPVHAFA